MDSTGPTPQSEIGGDEPDDQEAPQERTVRADVEATAVLNPSDPEKTVQKKPDPESWPSLLPTQRPQPRPALFGRLLAEAGTAIDDDDVEKTAAKPAPSAPPDSASSNPSLPPGQTIAGYRILGELGSGGMAVVYKAVQPSLDRLVAIKELRHEFLSDRQIRARFEREATSLAALQHGNIVHIFDFLHDDENAYIVMEYVDGIDLFDLLGETKSLPPDVACIVALQMALALEYAHYRGIVHRDIKPSNILLSRTGELKVMDFGIARDAERVDLTQVGMALGTPAYMAPEQIAGDRVDFRADIFNFGIVFYEILTGQKPWGEDEAGKNITRKVLYEPYDSPRKHDPNFLPDLEAIIHRCLQKEPEDRYDSTHALRREIERFVSREVSIDPRQRLVTFLQNRGILSEGEASSHVAPSILQDPVYRRRDRGVRTPPAAELTKPLTIAAISAFFMILLGAIIGGTVGFGARLPDAPPDVHIRAPEASETSAPTPAARASDPNEKKSEPEPSKKRSRRSKRRRR